MDSWEVDLELVADWLDSLDQDSYEQVIAAIEVLADRGPHLGRPLVDTVEGSSWSNMKELRPGSSGSSELRILFAFDPARQAILLIGGNKADRWKSWYQKALPAADELFRQHISSRDQRARKGKRRK